MADRFLQDYVTFDEACKILDRTKSTILHYVDCSQLTPIVFSTDKGSIQGSITTFKRSEVEGILERRKRDELGTNINHKGVLLKNLMVALAQGIRVCHKNGFYLQRTKNVISVLPKTYRGTDKDKGKDCTTLALIEPQNRLWSLTEVSPNMTGENAQGIDKFLFSVLRMTLELMKDG